MSTTSVAAREQAILFEEEALSALRQQIANTKGELLEMEVELEHTMKRIRTLRQEPGNVYSSTLFHSELRQHGCIACATLRAGGELAMRVHTGGGPECPGR